MMKFPHAFMTFTVRIIVRLDPADPKFIDVTDIINSWARSMYDGDYTKIEVTTNQDSKVDGSVVNVKVTTHGSMDPLTIIREWIDKHDELDDYLCHRFPEFIDVAIEAADFTYNPMHEMREDEHGNLVRKLSRFTTPTTFAVSESKTNKERKDND